MRAFLVTAEEGSFSAAARSLGQTQPTLSRQIAALEEELDLMLFERVGRGLELTTAGQQMLTHVREMGTAADKVAIVATGQSQSIEGEVRVTASDVLSAYHLPTALKRIRALAPKLRVEVIATNDIRDLMRREADIAIRHMRPDQPDLVARLIREANGYFYASKDYIAARGEPKTLADMAAHDFISYGDINRMIAYLSDIGIKLNEGNFHTGSENGLVAWEMSRAGLGISPMDEFVGQRHSDMVHILPKMPPIKFPVWLITHREIHTNPRIRLVFDVLAEVLGKP